MEHEIFSLSEDLHQLNYTDFSVMTAHVHLTGLYKHHIEAFPPNWQQNRDQNEAVKT